MKFHDLPDLTDKDRQRFFSNTKIADAPHCWEWQAGTDGKYGKMSVKGQEYKAHRLSYFINKGVKPNPSKDVCHTCDNPICVNPEHLFEGTRQENLLDCIAKGRNAVPNPPKGDESAFCVITDKDVADIQTIYASGLFSTWDIAERYEVARSLIHRIIDGKQRTDKKLQPTRKHKENRMRLYLEKHFNAFFYKNTVETFKEGKSTSKTGWTVAIEAGNSTFYSLTEIKEHFGFTEIDIWSEAIEFVDSLY